MEKQNKTKVLAIDDKPANILALEKSDLLINNAADIIGIIDASTFEIEEINNAFMDILGYSKEEAKGTSITFFLGPEDQLFVQELSKTKKNLLSFETPIYCKERTLKWLQWKVVVKAGKWFVNARDISIQKKADEQIKQLNTDLQTNIVKLELANKELESFSYSVSHDLRAPLRAIKAYTKFLLEDHAASLDGDAVKMLHSVADSAERMNQLIDDLLAFSRMGKQQMDLSIINMTDVVKASLQNIKMAHNNKIDAKINLDELLPAFADHSLMINVFTNLISNAIKYSSKTETPVIEISSYTRDGENIYCVKDNGVGFDMKYYDKLFGVFQRLHSIAEFEGTGIGLALVKRIITRHGGRVWAEAETGKGATFYVSVQSITN